MLLAFPTNIRLEWKWQTLTNTLAYYGMEFIMTSNSFIALAEVLLASSQQIISTENWKKMPSQFANRQSAEMTSKIHNGTAHFWMIIYQPATIEKIHKFNAQTV